MVYITLDELKEILPEILDQWIDEDDESWEWIFQEIEQKCHVGKKKKDEKKQKKLDELTRKVDVITPQLIADLNSRNDKLTKRVDELSNKISNLSSSNASMNSKINTLSRDINAAKSMAQTARDRTQVDYTKTEAQVAQNIYNRMADRGATIEELDSFRKVVKKYDATSYSWNKEKMCETCKYVGRGDCSPCTECNYNDKWEAKENG